METPPPPPLFLRLPPFFLLPPPPIIFENIFSISPKSSNQLNPPTYCQEIIQELLEQTKIPHKFLKFSKLSELTLSHSILIIVLSLDWIIQDYDIGIGYLCMLRQFGQTQFQLFPYPRFYRDDASKCVWNYQCQFTIGLFDLVMSSCLGDAQALIVVNFLHTIIWQQQLNFNLIKRNTPNDSNSIYIQTNEYMSYHQLNEDNGNHQVRVQQIEKELFDYYKLTYHAEDIKISECQSIHAVFIPTINNQGNECQNYFIGHGFGGSSLMNFASILPLLKKGNVILWQIRGMGLSVKLNQYLLDDLQDIQAFFLKTIEVLLLHYKYTNSIFIGHSFSSYLILLFYIRFPDFAKRHIKKMVLLSPIGITVKQQDYKHSIRSCKDFFRKLLNKFAWAFQITYKSALRTVCSCCKQSLVMSSLKQFGTEQEQKYLMRRLIDTLIGLPDGSQSLFFKLFQPRVIPKIALQPLLTEQPLIDMLLVYGGAQDWADKTGAQKLRNRFVNKIRLLNIQECGHNIPFNTAVCKQIYNDLL